ncbi:MAG: TetR/AcrR family transcriptional regulator [Alistipes sp.]|nr:TetR/AcrR family transcriptional regulator [Alistipes sp.]
MTQKEYIIERASEMFVANGIKSVRVDDIAQSLGMSKRTLYEMFGDKEELIYLCMSYFLEKQRNDINLIAKDTSTTILEVVLQGFLNMMQYTEVNHRIMNNLQRFYPKVFERIRQESGEVGRTNLRNAIHKCVNEGFFDNKFNMDLAITVLYYTSMGVIARQDFPYPQGVSQHEAFRHIIVCFFRGVATPKGLEVIDNFIAKNGIKI